MKAEAGQTTPEQRMSNCFHDAPVACSLTTPELREREATLLAHFKSRVVETEELPEGFVLRLSAEEGSIQLAAGLIVTERECCPFLSFELAALPNAGPVILRITGPAGSKEFLRDMFLKPETSS